jgi:hypothetical protein
MQCGVDQRARAGGIAVKGVADRSAKRQRSWIVAAALVAAFLVYACAYGVWRSSEACQFWSVEEWASTYNSALARDYLCVHCDSALGRAAVYVFWPPLRLETWLRDSGFAAETADEQFLRW